MTATTKTIVLNDINGIAKKSGVDQYGCHWVEFTVDYFAQEEIGECSICHAAIESGWLCLDGGEEVCADHVATNDEDLPVCTVCEQIIPSMEIYYEGKDGKDYCQHCYDPEVHGEPDNDN